MTASMPLDEKAQRDEWDRRAAQDGLYAVMSRRWSPGDCARVHQQHVELITTWLSPLEGSRVLDVGCGVGRLSVVLAGRGASVIGVDTSEVMLGRARPAAAGLQVQFFCAPADHLPLGDEGVDHAVAVMVLQHIVEDRRFAGVLSELVRVVRPGGRIVIVDGLSTTRYTPANSPVTLVRTLTDYGVLRRDCSLLSIGEVDYAGDRYTPMLWERLR